MVLLAANSFWNTLLPSLEKRGDRISFASEANGDLGTAFSGLQIFNTSEKKLKGSGGSRLFLVLSSHSLATPHPNTVICVVVLPKIRYRLFIIQYDALIPRDKNKSLYLKLYDSEYMEKELKQLYLLYSVKYVDALRLAVSGLHGIQIHKKILDTTQKTTVPS